MMTHDFAMFYTSDGRMLAVAVMNSDRGIDHWCGNIEDPRIARAELVTDSARVESDPLPRDFDASLVIEDMYAWIQW